VRRTVVKTAVATGLIAGLVGAGQVSVISGPLTIAFTAVVLACVHPKAMDQEGTCEGCGYDLTGNVSGICPECGRPVTIHA
jgi:hypothetical protein